MATDIFAVVLEQATDEIRQRVTGAYPNALRYTDDVFLISTAAVADTIATNIGIRPEAEPSPVVGAVFRLRSDGWGGFASPSLWEWLRKNREQ